jgi:hypothetical protein
MMHLLQRQLHHLLHHQQIVVHLLKKNHLHYYLEVDLQEEYYLLLQELRYLGQQLHHHLHQNHQLHQF